MHLVETFFLPTKTLSEKILSHASNKDACEAYTEGEIEDVQNLISQSLYSYLGFLSGMVKQQLFLSFAMFEGLMFSLELNKDLKEHREVLFELFKEFEGFLKNQPTRNYPMPWGEVGLEHNVIVLKRKRSF